MDIRQAIHEDAVAHGYVEGDEILMDFVVVSAWQAIDGTPKQCTYVLQSDESTAAHIAIGLLSMGIDQCRDEDDDG